MTATGIVAGVGGHRQGWLIGLWAILVLFCGAQHGYAADQPPLTPPVPAAPDQPTSTPVAPTTPIEPAAATPKLPKYYVPPTEPQDPSLVTSDPVFTTFLWFGFTHIIPEGFDHILFVVGLFLLSPKLKPLLVQITAFTIAHSITLGLCLANLIHLPSAVVEPTIAASICFVAIENICYRDLKPWRWMVVFGFGLIHGLGFADALKELQLPAGHFFPALISFNLGVECGQLAVIAIAAALTCWFWKKPWYRKVIVIPASSMIAAVGLFWAVQRVWTSFA